MRFSTKAVAVIAVPMLAAAAILGAILINRPRRAPSLPAPFVAAVDSDVVRTDRNSIELSYSSDVPDPIKVLGAEALSQASNLGHRALPSSEAISNAARAVLASGGSPVLVAETLALSAHALALRQTSDWMPQVVRPHRQPSDWSTDEVRQEAARGELSGQTSEQCRQAQSLIAVSLIRALLLWPMSSCPATAAQATAVRRNYAALGTDAAATRSLAAAYRITAGAYFRSRLEQRAAELTSITYPSYMSADSADSLVLIAVSGVALPRSAGSANYIFQQRMTRGGLVDPGQEAGSSVGYAAVLSRRVLNREPMLADAELKLAGADSVLAAADAAYEIAALGRRDPALLEHLKPALARELRAYPGIPGLFLRKDCRALGQALDQWQLIVNSAELTESIRSDPAMALMLALDAVSIRGCTSLLGRAAGALSRIDAAAAQASRLGALPGASLKSSWTATRLACVRGDARQAKRIVKQAGFSIATALQTATSTDDLFYIYRLLQASAGRCDDESMPW
jgi:hypothetical protein